MVRKLNVLPAVHIHVRVIGTTRSHSYAVCIPAFYVNNLVHLTYHVLYPLGKMCYVLMSLYCKKSVTKGREIDGWVYNL